MKPSVGKKIKIREKEWGSLGFQWFQMLSKRNIYGSCSWPYKRNIAVMLKTVDPARNLHCFQWVGWVSERKRRRLHAWNCHLFRKVCRPHGQIHTKRPALVSLYTGECQRKYFHKCLTIYPSESSYWIKTNFMFSGMLYPTCTSPKKTCKDKSVTFALCSQATLLLC